MDFQEAVGIAATLIQWWSVGLKGRAGYGELEQFSCHSLGLFTVNSEITH